MNFPTIAQMKEVKHTECVKSLVAYKLEFSHFTFKWSEFVAFVNPRMGHKDNQIVLYSAPEGR